MNPEEFDPEMDEQDKISYLIITDLTPKISEYAAKGYGPVAITLGFLQMGISTALGTGCAKDILLLMFIMLIKRVQAAMLIKNKEEASDYPSH
jgi:hypothetical protein